MYKKILLAFGIIGLTHTPLFAGVGHPGEAVYKRICHLCHGIDMDGGIGPSLIDSFWKHGDTPENILNTISEGIPHSEMVAYKHLLKEDEIKAVRDYLISKQQGLRSLVLSTYPRNHFKDKELSLKLLKSIESSEQKNIKENLIYFKNRYNGTSHLEANLHIIADGEYQLKIRNIGRTAAYINGEKVLYQDDQQGISLHLCKVVKLKKGIHKIEIIHDEEPQHALKFHAVLINKAGGYMPFMGRSLEGSEPKIVRASGQAKVMRKYIHGISPRTLLCFLPNKIIVAYNPYKGKVEAVWKKAYLDQTPSLNARSANASVIKGDKAEVGLLEISTSIPIKLRSYRCVADRVEITTTIGDKLHTITIAPVGLNSYSINGQSEGNIPGFSTSFTKNQVKTDSHGSNFKHTLN